MTREEAQQQLMALAQAIRAGKAVTGDEFPVLCQQTEQGILLWRLSGKYTTHRHWDEEQMADWYEHEAINILRLDRQ